MRSGLFSDHTPIWVLAQSDSEKRGVVVPLVYQLDAADRYGGIDRHGFSDFPAEAGGMRAVLRCGSVRTGVVVEVPVVQQIEGVPLGGQL